MEVPHPAPPKSGLQKWRSRALWGGLGAIAVLTAVLFAPSSEELYREERRIRGELLGEPDQLFIDISFEDMKTIEADRAAALAAGVRDASSNRSVKTRVVWPEGRSEGKVRLKGAFPDHWKGDRWSLKFSLTNGGRYKGMSSFVIQSPETAGYLTEHYFQRSLRHLGLLHMRSGVAEVTLNGEEAGVYSWFEQLSKLTVESQKRREGPMLQIDKQQWLQYRKNGVRPPPQDSYFKAPVVPASVKHYRASPALTELYKTAMGRLEAYRRGSLSVQETFDVDKLASAAALTAVFGSYEFDWKDLVFYYDPVAGRFEVLAKEIHPSPNLRRHMWWVGRERSPDRVPFMERLFRDEAFVSALGRRLGEYCHEDFLAELRSAAEAELDQLLLSLWRQEQEIPLPYEDLESACRVINDALDLRSTVAAHLESEGPGPASVRIQSHYPFPLEVVALRQRKGEFRVAPLKKSVVQRALGPLARVESVRFQVPQELLSAGDLEVELRLPGTERDRRAPLLPWPPSEPRAQADEPASPDADLAQAFDVDHENRSLSCKKQSRVEKKLTTPRGYSVSCGAGASIALGEGGGLLIRGPVHLAGTAEQPVTITGEPGNRGVLVLQAGEESRLLHVQVSGLGVPPPGVRNVTGALTFYESDVDIAHSSLTDNRGGDDLLNVVRSKVSLTEVTVERSQFDAIDFDFVTGKVKNLTINDAGNDGLDASGSELKLSTIEVNGAGDKGLSIGEQTMAEVEHAKIRAAQLCVASKDASRVTIRDSELDQCGVALTAYQKKPEFGAATIVAERVQMGSGVQQKEEADDKSQVIWLE